MPTFVRQELDLTTATVTLFFDNDITIDVFSDINSLNVSDSISCNIDSPNGHVAVSATIDRWRTEYVVQTDASLGRGPCYPDGQGPPLYPDTIVDMNELGDGQIGWFYANDNSIFAETLEKMMLGNLVSSIDDPLLNRVSGATIYSSDEEVWSTVSQNEIKSTAKFTHSLNIDTFTSTVKVDPIEIMKEMKAREPSENEGTHEEWWSDFWDRSFIDVKASSTNSNETEETAGEMTYEERIEATSDATAAPRSRRFASLTLPSIRICSGCNHASLRPEQILERHSITRKPCGPPQRWKRYLGI